MWKIKLLIIVVLLSILNQSCLMPIFKPITEEEIQNTITKINSSKIIVLDVYHKNCGSCKYIEPVIKDLERIYSKNPDIIFLKYDLTNPFTIYNSRKIAKASGLESIYNEQRFSGIVHVISSKEKKVIASLISQYNIDTYKAIIEKRLEENAT